MSRTGKKLAGIIKVRLCSVAAVAQEIRLEHKVVEVRPGAVKREHNLLFVGERVALSGAGSVTISSDHDFVLPIRETRQLTLPTYHFMTSWQKCFPSSSSYILVSRKRF